MTQINNMDVLYQTDKIVLLNNNNNLFFTENGNTYHITSHPYEPCLYLNLDNKIVKIIHNSFTNSEIIDVAEEKYKIDTISGNKYDIAKICELLSCAVNSSIYETDISYLEKQMKNPLKSNKINNIKKEQIQNEENFTKNTDITELSDDLFYKEYKKYNECVLDYCILKVNSKYNFEESHKQAVIFAMEKWKKFLKDKYDMEIYYNKDKMKANKLKSNEFFVLPSKNYNEKNKPYWYLFLKPPHGSTYNIDDFKYINNILFPNGFDNLEIYNWSTDWSNYFDDGLEWWGAMCVSIYDKSLNRFVVIGASATD